ncbi:hypothetical protein JKP88DRAFT_351244 [Tribonema minus]|uniref:PDZ domain-containing protein n=1 Tax=Tribonema minus TaxID=303371 RepID=A0A835YID5_9STRA|nr:hypothetical protein JKP88DRAFT_351244 [Tribonema minus]
MPFDALKKLLKKPIAESLSDSGARAAPAEGAPADAGNLELTFTEDVLGMKLQEADGRVVVTGVVEGSQAQRLGVATGDVLLQLEGQAVHTCSGFAEVVQAIGRPVHVTVGKRRAAAAASVGDAFAASFRKMQDSANTNFEQAKAKVAAPPPPPPLSADARAAQREAVLRAAEARTKAWDHRLQRKRAANAASSQSPEPPGGEGREAAAAAAAAAAHPETQRVVELCRSQEAAMAAQLGYDPFKSVTVAHAEARQAAAAAAAPPPPPPTAAHPAAAAAANGDSPDAAAVALAVEESEQMEALALMEEVDAALSLILSHSGDGDGSSGGGGGGGGDDAARAAVETLHKLLSNMATKREDKFRRVRVSNRAFAERVAAVPGGVDVMVCAGFQLLSDEAEAYLFYAEPLAPPSLRLRVALHRLALVRRALGTA